MRYGQLQGWIAKQPSQVAAAFFSFSSVSSDRRSFLTLFASSFKFLLRSHFVPVFLVMSGIETLGAVAAATQLAKNCLEIVQFVSRVRNAPDSAKTALLSLENTANVLDAIRNDLDSSHSQHSVDIKQLFSLRDKAQALCAELKTQFDRLDVRQGDTALRKAGKAIKIVTRDKALSALFDRIDNLKADLDLLLSTRTFRALQVLASDTASGHQAIQRSIVDSSASMQARLDGLNDSTALESAALENSIQASTVRLETSVQNMRSDAVLGYEAVQRDISNNTSSTHAALNNLGSSLQRVETRMQASTARQEMGFQSLALLTENTGEKVDRMLQWTAKQDESCTMRDRQLVKAVSAAQDTITSQIDQSSHNAANLILEAISGLNVKIGGLQAAIEPPPSALHRVVLPGAKQKMASRKLQKQHTFICSCVARKQSKYSVGGFNWINWTQWKKHDSSCLFRTRDNSGVEVTVRRRLPLSTQMMELVLRATVGAGCLSITPRLQFHATVQRETSPAFKLFDDIIFLFWEIMAEERVTQTLKPQKDEVERLLNDLTQSLVSCFQTGSASATDQDERGNTLLLVSSQRMPPFEFAQPTP